MMKHEKRVAKELGGQVTRASGSVFTDKGDVVARKLKLVVQCKETQQNKFQITNTMLDKCIRDAFRQNPEFFGAMFITFRSETGRVVIDQIVVPEEYLNLHSSLKEIVVKRANEINNMTVTPDLQVAKFKDKRNRVWYIIPSNVYSLGDLS
jgi:Holliday junction resolvase